MSPDTALVDFVFNLIRSGIISSQQARYSYRQYRDAGLTESLQDVCNFLVGNGTITEWQCDKLKQGKWRGFQLDDYLLLEQVGKGELDCSYRSRDIRDGSIVRLVITPTRLTGGKIEYRVERDIG